MKLAKSKYWNGKYKYVEAKASNYELWVMNYNERIMNGNLSKIFLILLLPLSELYYNAIKNSLVKYQTK